MDKNMQPLEELDPIIDFNSKIKTLESKYNLSRDRLFLINQNMIDQFKSTSSDLRLIKEEVKDLKTELNSVKETIATISKELNRFVRKEEVKVIEKYVSLWDPLKFVTEDQLKEILENASRKKRK